eukprot:gnl/MRDRNA2_/MRDRNA2_121095_c0_seq1.p1 gnl/MRDRNA2_/MRDRNA2_121095_c0~~gnl/MRDRNA2_/MRDRNA2_121095_c0_seq1.p1  ORF type:complete len:471 (+),score=87.72 gnl/MRDRNA2_/MRDRNA2_121095_c0_seq1:96-1508(+)
MSAWDARHVAGAAIAGVVGTVAALEYFKRSSDFFQSGSKRRRSSNPEPTASLETQDNRSHKIGVTGRWTKPVVIASPNLEEMADTLRRRLGCEQYSEEEGPTIDLGQFKSGDPNLKFHWQRIVGRKIVFLFDTVDQTRLFEQLALLQALQGFAVPDGEDKKNKWKTYVESGSYSWGRASHVTVIIPWYRPCQMERMSRWQLVDGKWQNGDSEGQWLDVPTAQYMARLLSTPGSVPPLPGPSAALDGMPLHPLWRPPLEILFVELHEEIPVRHSVSDLGATVRTERFVPYFLEKFKAKEGYAGPASTYVLFPDRGAYVRYVDSVKTRLRLDMDHILYIKKTRVGDSIEQTQELFFDEPDNEAAGSKTSFLPTDHLLIIDDFTNSGSTLLGAVNLAQKMVEGGKFDVSIFVSHLVASYDPKIVEGLLKKLHAIGPQCKFYTTNTIPMTTNVLKGDPQAQVIDISDFIAGMVH